MPSLVLAAGQRHDLPRRHFNSCRAPQRGEPARFAGFPSRSNDHDASVRRRLELNGGPRLDAKKVAHFLGNCDLSLTCQLAAHDSLKSNTNKFIGITFGLT